MTYTYTIAGHHLEFIGPNLQANIERLGNFRPFLSESSIIDMVFEEVEDEVPTFQQIQYTLKDNNVLLEFGTINNGHLFSLTPDKGDKLHIWVEKDNRKALLRGNQDASLLRLALWIGYGLLTLDKQTIALHSSCIVYQDKAVLFLGESGTGKSTHTRLWREHIEGSFLLNDDSPILRKEGDNIYIYGSPWSGKTPCYKQERHLLKGVVRLSQAPFNAIKKLTFLEGYAAIHPSCAPEFAYDTSLYDQVSQLIGEILTTVPCYNLACLPNKEAAILSCHTLFNE